MRQAIVRLTPAELYNAANVGIQRRIRAMLRPGSRPRFDWSDGQQGWEQNVQGAIGELVTAKYLDRYWSGAGTSWRDDDDVGGVEVRYNSWTKDDAWLIVYPHPRDHAAAPFVLVTRGATDLDFVIRGWAPGRDCQQDRYWRPVSATIRAAAYFVPQSDLRSIDTLQPWLDDRASAGLGGTIEESFQQRP
jgi:hypothetical protein